MPFLNGITLLLLFQLLGEVTARWLHLPVPGPVIGMGYLFLVLLLHGGVPVALETASTALLNHLSLLFIPAGVGLMVYFDEIAREWLPIVLTLLLSTLLTMVVVALAMQALVRRFTPKDQNQTTHQEDAP